jgi:AraC-like DNA-binding protein
MHLVLATEGTLRVRAGDAGAWRRAAGVLTAPDVPHAIDAEGVVVLLVFFDPESEAGVALGGALAGAVRLVQDDDRARLLDGATPDRIMQADGVAWTQKVVGMLGGGALAPRQVHPRVRRVVKHLRTTSPEADVSLAALAEVAGLSEGRLMHAFTESVGLPIRPYLAWLKLQRAAAAVTMGVPLAQAAALAGFADAAHMSRAFRRMLGMTPSAIRGARVAR